ncbi:MAG: AsnC family protein [Candidatus Diapherotrites archaeon]|nr:AsnC family protein [Candidatus Diapherotrites archaeon]
MLKKNGPRSKARQHKHFYRIGLMRLKGNKTRAEIYKLMHKRGLGRPLFNKHWRITEGVSSRVELKQKMLDSHDEILRTTQRVIETRDPLIKTRTTAREIAQINEEAGRQTRIAAREARIKEIARVKQAKADAGKLRRERLASSVAAEMQPIDTRIIEMYTAGRRKISDLAAVTGLSPTAVESSLRRIKKRLPKEEWDRIKTGGGKTTDAETSAVRLRTVFSPKNKRLFLRMGLMKLKGIKEDVILYRLAEIYGGNPKTLKSMWKEISTIITRGELQKKYKDHIFRKIGVNERIAEYREQNRVRQGHEAELLIGTNMHSMPGITRMIESTQGRINQAFLEAGKKPLTPYGRPETHYRALRTIFDLMVRGFDNYEIGLQAKIPPAELENYVNEIRHNLIELKLVENFNEFSKVRAFFRLQALRRQFQKMN